MDSWTNWTVSLGKRFSLSKQKMTKFLAWTPWTPLSLLGSGVFRGLKCGFGARSIPKLDKQPFKRGMMAISGFFRGYKSLKQPSRR
jgi:hypothetical protein